MAKKLSQAQIEQRRKAGQASGKKIQEEVKQARETLKKYAERNIKPLYTRLDIFAWRLADYIAQARSNDRPLTETGLIVALRIAETSYKKYASGERDYILLSDIEGRQTDKEINIEIEQIKNRDNGDIQAIYNYLIEDTDETVPSFSEVAKKARLLVTLEREERLAKSGKVGDIFTMKAREHWQDEKERTTNILQITTNNAEQALKLLGFQQTKQIEE